MEAVSKKKTAEMLGSEEKTRLSQFLVRFCQENLVFSDFVHATGRVTFNIDGRRTVYVTLSDMASPNVLQNTADDASKKFDEVVITSSNNCDKTVKNANIVQSDSPNEVRTASRDNQNNTSENSTSEADNDSDTSYHPTSSIKRINKTKSQRRKRYFTTEQKAEESLYHCTFCTFSAQTLDVLQDHLKMHTPEEKQKETCHDCQKSFLTADALTKHKKKVHEKNISCSTCNETFQSLVLLKKHGREIHKLQGKISIVSCKECKKTFFDEESMLTHCTLDHNFLCSVCEETFTQKRALHQHRDKCHPESLLTCPRCNQKCSSKGALRKHILRHDERENGNFTCDICHKRFTAQSTLYHHKRGVHSGIKPYKCTQCEKTFNFHHSLKLHLLQHNGQRPHKCSICNKAYLTSSHLKSHIEAVHSANKKHSCPICDKAFPYENSLKMHMMLHTGEKPFMCCICSKSFVSKSALKVHESSHLDSKDYQCDICRKMYKTEVLLRAHRRRHTSDGSRFMCDVCGNTFMYKSNLEAHYKVHGNSRSFKCDLCDKAFKTYATLYSHQLVHRQDNPFTCKHCDKAFKTKERLKAHEKRHLGLKPYCCELCGSCFPDKGGLSKHRKTVHATKTRFACPICQKGCNRADNLRVHMKVHGDPDILKLSLQQLELKNIDPNQMCGTDIIQTELSLGDDHSNPSNNTLHVPVISPQNRVVEFDDPASRIIYRPPETTEPHGERPPQPQRNPPQNPDIPQLANNLFYMQYQSYVGSNSVESRPSNSTQADQMNF